MWTHRFIFLGGRIWWPYRERERERGGIGWRWDSRCDFTWWDTSQATNGDLMWSNEKHFMCLLHSADSLLGTATALQLSLNTSDHSLNCKLVYVFGCGLSFFILYTVYLLQQDKYNKKTKLCSTHYVEKVSKMPLGIFSKRLSKCTVLK